MDNTRYLLISWCRSLSVLVYIFEKHLCIIAVLFGSTMNEVIKVYAIILVINCFLISCYGVSIVSNVLGNTLNDGPAKWVDAPIHPEEKRNSEPHKDYLLLMDLYEQHISDRIIENDIERSNKSEQDSMPRNKVGQKERVKRQISWGYTTSLYPKLPTQAPYYNPSGPYNTQWQSPSSNTNQYNSSKPNPYNPYIPPYNQNQPKNPYNQPGYRPPYASYNVTTLRPQTHSTYPSYPNTNNSYPYNSSQRSPVLPYDQSNYNQQGYKNNPSQRPPTYHLNTTNYNQHVSGYTNKYPVSYRNSTTQRNLHAPQIPYTSTNRPSYPSYNPLENTVFNNVPQNRSFNNASGYPYQPQNPYNRPGQGSTNGTYSSYPSGQQSPNSPYDRNNPTYNQYIGYPRPNSSPYGYAPSYNDPTPRSYNVPYNSQNIPSYNNTFNGNNNPQYSSNTSTGHSNGIGPHYTPAGNQFPVNNPYPGQPLSYGTNAYSFGNAYNPSIPSQPPYNSGGDQNYFYYPQKPNNNLDDDPTRVPPNRYSY